MKKCLFILFLLFSNFSSSQENHPSFLVFSHVNVIDTINSSLSKDQTVVISNNRIVEVGTRMKLKMPSGARVIEARDKFLIPGLWDMHVHTFGHSPYRLNTWFFPLFIANGVTGVRDMWTKIDDMPQVVQWRNALVRSTFIGPRFVAVGTLVDGPEPFWANSDTVRTPQEAREFVHKLKAAHIDFVKVYWNLPREHYFAIADEAKKIGIPFVGHVPIVLSAAEASDAGQKSIEHFTNVAISCSTKESDLLQTKTWGQEQEQQTLETYDAKKCEELWKRFARNQTWQVPTSILYFSNRLVGDPRNKYVPIAVLKARAEFAKHDDLLQQPAALKERGEQQTLSFIAGMNRAGVPFMAGTDLSNLWLYPGFSLHDELAFFVRAGLAPGEALKTATYNPAKFLNMTQDFGTIEKGKIADVILLDANPLEDIHNTTKIRAVVLNGKYFDRTQLDRLLTDAERTAQR